MQYLKHSVILSCTRSRCCLNSREVERRTISSSDDRFDYSTTHRRRSNVKINTSFYGQRLLKDKCSKLVPLSNEENMSHRTLDTTARSRIDTDHRNDTWNLHVWQLSLSDPRAANGCKHGPSDFSYQSISSVVVFFPPQMTIVFGFF